MSVASRSIRLALAGLVSASSLAAAQGAVRAMIAQAPANRITLSAEQTRQFITTYHPAVAKGTSEDNFVTILLGANGSYLVSASSKAPTGGAVARLVPTSAPDAPAAAGGAGAAPSTFGRAKTMSVAGIGDIDTSLIQDVYTKNYEAGEVAPAAIRIRVITLNVNSLK